MDFMVFVPEKDFSIGERPDRKKTGRTAIVIRYGKWKTDESLNESFVIMTVWRWYDLIPALRSDVF